MADDDAISRSEEELRVSTEWRAVERVRVRRRVVEEEVSVPVRIRRERVAAGEETVQDPVRRERVELERDPPS